MRETRDFKPAIDDVPSIGAKLIHFKGNEYEVHGFAINANTLEQTVLYRELDAIGKQPWERPLPEFYQEVKDDDGMWVRRFRVVSITRGVFARMAVRRGVTLPYLDNEKGQSRIDAFTGKPTRND